MKNKILIFIIGLLIGAIITAEGFLLFGKPKGDFKNMPQMDENFNPSNIDFNNIDLNNINIPEQVE